MNEEETKLIDGFFNKGWCCDLDEVYKIVMKLQNNWNELKKKLERRINSYEERKKLGEGYELTEVMEISLACDKRFLKDMQEMEQGKDENNK